MDTFPGAGSTSIPSFWLCRPIMFRSPPPAADTTAQSTEKAKRKRLDVYTGVSPQEKECRTKTT